MLSFQRLYMEFTGLNRPYCFRVRSVNRLVITQPETTNCSSINFQVFTNDDQLNIIKLKFTNR